MTVLWLDHVNLRTAKLGPMSSFYETVLGLPRGPRPGFRSSGVWHYCGERAIVHLVELPHEISLAEAQIEHFALRATGPMRDFQARCHEHDVPYEVVTVADIEMRQLNIYDPDGNKIEVQFVARPDDDLGAFRGSPRAAERMDKGRALAATASRRASESTITPSNAALGVPPPIREPH